MTTPTTVPGRLLLAAGLTFHSGRRLGDHPEMVAAIEAEAVAAYRAALITEVGGLPPAEYGPQCHDCYEDMRAAVLDLIRNTEAPP